MPLVVDHIIARVRGGPTTLENLCLACHRCNEYKGDQIEAVDPQSSATVVLFHPSTQQWQEHFTWSRDGVLIVGRTAIGRATIAALRLNNEEVLAARYIWVAVGLHPPV